MKITVPAVCLIECEIHSQDIRGLDPSSAFFEEEVMTEIHPPVFLDEKIQIESLGEVDTGLFDRLMEDVFSIIKGATKYDA